MEVDYSIITALEENHTHGDLLQKTSALRKERGFGLSNQDFSKALTRLVENKIVLKPKKRGGEWKLNQETKELVDIELYYRKKPDEFFDFVESHVKNLENQIPHLNKIKDDDPSKKKFIKKIQTHITDIIRTLLQHQLIDSLIVDTAWGIPVKKRKLNTQTNRCKEIIKKLSFLTVQINKDGSDVTLLALLNEIQRGVNNASEKEYLSRNILLDEHDKS